MNPDPATNPTTLPMRALTLALACLLITLAACTHNQSSTSAAPLPPAQPVAAPAPPPMASPPPQSVTAIQPSHEHLAGVGT
ncbi:MAG: hypothetical protein ABSG46_05655, partial [Candidatus Binataceae bacterium]